jgi:hypothetical protein
VNKLRLIKWLVFGTLVGAPLTLFYLQNADTQVDVIFKLSPEFAWHLGSRGMSLPLLLILTFLIGMLACALPASFLVSRSGARLRGLRKRVDALQAEVDFARSSPSKTSKSPASGDFDDII